MKTRRQQFSLILLIVAAAVAGALAFAPTTVLAQPDPAKTAVGEKVYTEKKCAFCHSINGQGGKIGGDLNAVGAKRDAEWLRRFLKNPKGSLPKAKAMMPFQGTDQELDTLIAYLSSLK